jgi:ankyrin repeat protein
MFPLDPSAEITPRTIDLVGDTPLHVVAWQNDAEAVEALVAAGADVNASGEMGETPMHIAVKHGNERMARYLVSVGARADIVDEFGDTATDLARENGGNLAAIVSGAPSPNTSFEQTGEG